MKELYSSFVNPSNEYRGKPFWSWNGELTQDELIRQIDVFEKMGFGGFFMHSRTGLITEYLGEEWFELTRVCAEEAQKRGMEAWLYDEDRWPSGTAGGMVTEEPRFRLKFVKMYKIPVDQWEWRDSWIAAFECRLEGDAYYEGRRLRAEDALIQGSATCILAFEIVEMEPSSFYNGQTYVDTMNREATEAFIQITHEQYKDRIGGLFGGAVTGIFTDEPHRGPLMTQFNISNDSPEYMLPWTYNLFERFLDKFGYDLLDRLPEVFLLPEGRQISPVKWHIVDLLQEMFLDGYAKPLDEWCRKNGLILTGHVLHEDSLSAQTAMIGSVMRYYEHMEYPGIDILMEGNRCYWVAKQLSSVARQIGRKWLLSELYGCTGWQMPLEAHKAVGNWQTLFGINLRCHHLSWYSMEGESKRDYPASISFQSAWWTDYHAVETYFARLGTVISHGEPICHLLVIHPIESVWCQVRAGWANSLEADTPEIKLLEQQFANVFNWLSGSRIDFDYGDEEMLQRLAAVEHDEAGQAVFRVGKATYSTVLVAGMTTIRSSTLRQLEVFQQNGGTVIFAGEAPDYVDAEPSESCRELAGLSVRIPLNEEAISSIGVYHIGNQVAVFDEQGLPIADIFGQIRQDEEQTYVILLNINREASYIDTKVCIPYVGYVEDWNCLTGERFAAVATTKDGSTELVADFIPSGEKVYVITRNREETLATRTSLRTVAAYDLEGSFSYALDEPNVCVLDRASYKLNDGEWQEEHEILKLDRKVRQELDFPFRSGDMVQPWHAIKHKSKEEGKLHQLTLAYVFYQHAAAEITGGCRLAVERAEKKAISVNGRALELQEDSGWWIDPVFRTFPIPSEYLRNGENRIEITADFDEGTDLEALYLLGHFGVEVVGTMKTIGALPDRLNIGHLADQGLPFYGGAVSYVLPLESIMEPLKKHLATERGASVQLEIPGYEGACLRVGSAETGMTTIPWQPNRTDITAIMNSEASVLLDVVLTRRNTFGPLHMDPIYSAAYGPGHWLTEGEAFAEHYMLIPTGLTSSPRILLQAPVD
ncbi:hypothetical protein [Paenibacillus paridis]|uniref:hypothetical protein n=1 Tax=Paenibacillus paridis TaxID=2583376 RepID=UPI001120516C|nr:hypothetical protein [Paenibacillus paridis]